METKNLNNQNPDEIIDSQEENTTKKQEAITKEPENQIDSPETAEAIQMEEMPSEDTTNTETTTETEAEIEIVNEISPEEIIESIEPQKEDKAVIEDKVADEPATDLAADELVEEANQEKNEVVPVSSDEETHEEHEEDHEEDDDHEEDHEEETETIDYDSLSRDALVDMLEELVNNNEVNTIKKKVALIKVAFLKQNKEEQEKRLETQLSEDEDAEEVEVTKDEVEIRFNAAFGIYKEKRTAWIAQQEELKIENLNKKKLILEELKALIESEESLKKTYDEFRNLQEKWKEAGMVPKAEANNLWQNYHFLVEKFFDKVKINRELRDLDMKKNLESKIELCEKAEELILENSVIK